MDPMLQSLMALLQGKTPVQVVWTADLSYWMEGQKRAGKGDPAWETERGYLEFHRQLGVLPYYYYEKFWLSEPCYDEEIEIHSHTNGERTEVLYTTPLGKLIQESVFLPASSSTGVTKHFVESEADLDILLYIMEHRCLLPSSLDDYAQRRAVWQEYGGLPSIALPRSPLPALAYEWAGVQNMTFLMADCPAKVRRLFGLMEEQEDPILEAVCQAAPPLVHFADNLSSDNFAGLYDRWLGPTHQRRIQRLHAAGVRCAVHLDGSVRGLLPKLARVGFDAIEALTPKPAGDMEIEELRPTAGSQQVILWGGVPGVLFAPPYTWKEMEAHVTRVLQSWRGQPFILGVADQVPPDGAIDFCCRIADLITK